jgi:hypothetical protein
MSLAIKVAACVVVTALTACQQQATPAASAPMAPMPIASIQEIMASIVDPSADRVWESVGSTITIKGVEDKRPQTEEEWREVRHGVISLLESTNLLMMPGRRVVPIGGKMLDEGSEGVLTAAEAQQHFDAQSGAFVGLAGALREVSVKLLKAVDDRNVDALFELGTEMDSICESCHMTFWYPGQPIYRAKKN